MKIKNKIAAVALVFGLFAPGLALAQEVGQQDTEQLCGKYKSPVSDVRTNVLFKVTGPFVQENSFRIHVVDTNGNAWEQETLWGGQEKLYSTFVGQIWYVTNPFPSDNDPTTPDGTCYNAWAMEAGPQTNVFMNQ